MADVANINGYNVKDSQARQNFTDLAQFDKAYTVLAIPEENDFFTGYIRYYIKNLICYFECNLSPKVDLSQSVYNRILNAVLPAPLVSNHFSAGRNMDGSIINIQIDDDGNVDIRGGIKATSGITSYVGSGSYLVNSLPSTKLTTLTINNEDEWHEFLRNNGLEFELDVQNVTL